MGTTGDAKGQQEFRQDEFASGYVLSSSSPEANAGVFGLLKVSYVSFLTLLVPLKVCDVSVTRNRSRECRRYCLTKDGLQSTTDQDVSHCVLKRIETIVFKVS